MDKLLDLLFIQTCRFCGAIGSRFCTKCLDRCIPLHTQYCLYCGKESDQGITHKDCVTEMSASQLVTTFAYNDVVRDCIRSSKFKHKEFALLKLLLLKATQASGDWFRRLGDYTLIPVPISKQRLKDRGFNQAELMTQSLVGYFKMLRSSSRLVVRSSDTKAQYKNDRKDRFSNVKNAFVLPKPDLIKGNKFVLVDDITSSGATFLEISKTLKNAGAGDIKCYALSQRLLQN